MNIELKNALDATDQKAQYDASAKRLLSEKHILSHILVRTVNEFRGMMPDEVIEKIEGEPYVSSVPVEPGLTNRAEGDRVVGFNTDNSEINEGLVRFDIVFYVRTSNGLSQIIINLEAQKDEPKEYNVLNRALYYVARLVSSQKERDFTNSNYDDIKQVYSIWICMNAAENSMSHYHLTRDSIVGTYEWAGKIDLFNIVMIGLTNELPERSEKYELHRLLAAVLSNGLSRQVKQKIVGEEYGMHMEVDVRGGLDIMCNLGQGIEDMALEKGRAEGLEIGRIEGEKAGAAQEKLETALKMREKGMSIDVIQEITGLSPEEYMS